jgi:hypothetical protein
MKMDLFGGRTVEGYDPNDEPGPQGISFNELKLIVECSFEDGLVRWKVDRYAGLNHNQLAAKAGDILPIVTSINSHVIRAHQIIWVFAHNGDWCWPPNEIDHRDGDYINNKIINLREASRSQNSMNQRKRNNKSGVTGVRFKSGKWYASITVNYKSIKLGYSSDFDEAVAMRKAAEQEYFGEYSRDASRGPFKYSGTQLF